MFLKLPLASSSGFGSIAESLIGLSHIGKDGLMANVDS
jgi:hypothetical protein